MAKPNATVTNKRAASAATNLVSSPANKRLCLPGDVSGDINSQTSTTASDCETTFAPSEETKVQEIDKPGRLSLEVNSDPVSTKGPSTVEQTTDSTASDSAAQVEDLPVATTTDTPQNVTLLDLVSTPRVSGATIASMLGKKQTKDSKNTEGPYLEDLEYFSVKILPDTCEVTNEELQDEVFRTDYVHLPPLKRGIFLSWAPDASGSGNPVFSTYWPETVPGMRLWNCIDAIRFNQSNRYINPSRTSPLVVRTKSTTADGRNPRLYVKSTPAICVTSLCLTESFLHHVPTSGLRQKQIRGLVHSQEWERMCAFMCMVFDQKELHAQLYKDSISFSTKTAGFSNGAQSSLFKQSPNFKSNAERPANVQTANTEKFLLTSDDIVPVYDARDIDFNLKENIENMTNLLPKIDNEIPSGSFVVVGYTAAAYISSKDREWHVSLNLQWVIVMGTP